jgi:hypothetical protein
VTIEFAGFTNEALIASKGVLDAREKNNRSTI